MNVHAMTLYIPVKKINITYLEASHQSWQYQGCPEKFDNRLMRQFNG